MKRTRFIIALALLLIAQTAAKADSHIMNATAHVISLVFAGDGIEELREQKPFETYALCLAWKHQKEILPPHPPAFNSFVYCEETQIRPKAEGMAVDVAKSDPKRPEADLSGRRPDWSPMSVAGSYVGKFSSTPRATAR